MNYFYNFKKLTILKIRLLNRDVITLNLNLLKIVAYRNLTFLLNGKPLLNYIVACYVR